MKTNLEKIKEFAKTLLYTDIHYLEYGFVSHPFANHTIQMIRENNKTELLDLTKNDDVERWRKYLSHGIDTISSVQQFLIIIHKPYLPVFFKYIKDYLSDKDYANMLYEIWIAVEYPNHDVNVSTSEFMSMFRTAKKKFLMNQEEQLVFDSLPETITVYRGIQKDATTNALSWTLDKNVAKWFANRFNNNGAVVEATINKKHVFAYINGRNEKEVVVNYKKLVFGV